MHIVKHALPAKCVLNVLFLVADFKPSRGIETYSKPFFTLLFVVASIIMVSHKAMLN